jgi:hypothetical protein
MALTQVDSMMSDRSIDLRLIRSDLAMAIH